MMAAFAMNYRPNEPCRNSVSLAALFASSRNLILHFFRLLKIVNKYAR